MFGWSKIKKLEVRLDNFVSNLTQVSNWAGRIEKRIDQLGRMIEANDVMGNRTDSVVADLIEKQLMMEKQIGVNTIMGMGTDSLVSALIKRITQVEKDVENVKGSIENICLNGNIADTKHSVLENNLEAMTTTMWDRMDRVERTMDSMLETQKEIISEVEEEFGLDSMENETRNEMEDGK